MKKREWRQLAKQLRRDLDRAQAEIQELQRRAALTPEERAAEDKRRAEDAESARLMAESLRQMQEHVYGVQFPALRARTFPLSPSGREPLTLAQAVERVPRLARASFPADVRCWLDHDRGRVVLEWSRGELAMIAPPHV